MNHIKRLIRTPLTKQVFSILALILLTAPSMFAATIYVSPAGGGDGAGPGSPTTLQAALTAAQANGQTDTIYLQAGNYPTSANPFSYNASQNDEVRLSGGWNTGFTSQYRGMDPAAMTALNGQNLNRVFQVLNDSAEITVKFTMENVAFLNGKGIDAHGAGLRSQNTNGGTINLFIRRCLFKDNRGQTSGPATYGGGMYANCYFELTDSLFTNNAAYGGGGMYIVASAPYTLSPLIDRCSFDNNATLILNTGGADIDNRASTVIRNSRFYGKTDNTSSGGGAINHVGNNTYGAGTLRVINCIISGKKSSYWGAGISIWDANAEIVNTLFANNTAGTGADNWGRGGGISIYDPSPTSARTVKVFNCTFVKNRSEGENDGLLGMAIDNRIQALTVVNSIFWDNGTTNPINIESGTATVTYSDVQGGFTGTGNINTNPGFVDFTNNNFHLTAGSLCKDTGTNNPLGTSLYALYPTSSDLDGRSRIINGGISKTVDMGAYEFDNSQYAHATGRGDPNLAYDPVNQRYLAVYAYMDGIGGATLYGRLINPDGTPHTTGLKNGLYPDEFQISEQKSYARLLSSVAYDGFNKKFVVVWDVFNASTNDQDIQGQLVNPDGTLDGWNYTVSNQVAIAESRPAIAYDDTGHQTLVVWNNEFLPTNEVDVLGRFFEKDVAQGADAFPIANTPLVDNGNPALAFDGVNKRFLVVWADDRDFATSEGEIYGQLINSDRTLNGGNFSITENQPGDQKYPALAFNPSPKQYLVTWEHTLSGNDDVYGRLVKYDQTLIGNVFPISNTPAKQDSISVAFHPLAGRFLAVWQDDRDGAAGRNIYGQWIKEDGTLVDSNFPIVNLPNDQDFPKVAYGPGSFLVVYESLVNPGPPVTLDVGYVKIEYLGVTAKSIGNGSGSVVSNMGGINYLYPAVNEMASSILAPGANVIITATGDPAVSVSWEGTCTAAGGTESGNGTGLATCTFASFGGYQWVKVTFTQFTLWLPMILR